MIPWTWLLTCATVMILCVSGVGALMADGPEQRRAVRMLVGVACGYLIIRTFG